MEKLKKILVILLIVFVLVLICHFVVTLVFRFGALKMALSYADSLAIL